MDVALTVAGVDEAGRGPLAGPVVAAACLLSPDDPAMASYQDSKKISEKKRLTLYRHLRHHAVYGLGMASAAEIDELNIHHATLLAMKRALLALPEVPAKAVVDGLHCPKLAGCQLEAIVDGDALVTQIAAASIIAKVVRDRYMLRLHALFPAYGFNQHKGYGTKQHLRALATFGPSKHHRFSYAPVRQAERRELPGMKQAEA